MIPVAYLLLLGQFSNLFSIVRSGDIKGSVDGGISETTQSGNRLQLGKINLRNVGVGDVLSNVDTNTLENKELTGNTALNNLGVEGNNLVNNNLNRDSTLGNQSGLDNVRLGLGETTQGPFRNTGGGTGRGKVGSLNKPLGNNVDGGFLGFLQNSGGVLLDTGCLGDTDNENNRVRVDNVKVREWGKVGNTVSVNGGDETNL